VFPNLTEKQKEGRIDLQSQDISVLKDSKPTTLLPGCLHSWELKRQGDVFFLVCFWCHARIKAWKRLPKVFSNVLDAAAKLEPSYRKVSEADLRTAVSSLNLPSRSRSERARIWDVYATLHILLSLKAGGPRGNLAVKSKAVTKLIQVFMYPASLKTMPISSRKRYGFVVDAIKKLRLFCSFSSS
jgi:hypothetical protein